MASAPAAMACGGRSGWKPRCAAHQQRHPGVVRGGGVAGQVAGGPDVGGVAQEDGAGTGVGGQRGRHRVHGHRAGEPGAGVDLGPHPHRPQPGQDQPEQQGTVQRAGDDDLLAGLPDGQGQGLVPVRGAGHGEPAPVGPPQPRGPGLGVDPQRVGVLDRGHPAVQRRVAGHDRADQVLALLVPGHAHRAELAGRGLGGEAQPPGQQRGVSGQAERVARVSVRRWDRRDAGVGKGPHPPSVTRYSPAANRSGLVRAPGRCAAGCR
jgi:hypothetical protein